MKASVACVTGLNDGRGEHIALVMGSSALSGRSAKVVREPEGSWPVTVAGGLDEWRSSWMTEGVEIGSSRAKK